MNGSAVMARIAGIESTAKTTSVVSMTSSVTNIGVATSLPAWRMKKCCSWYSPVTGMNLRSSRSIGLRSGWISFSFSSAMRIPVKTRNAPKMYTIQWKRWMRATPAKMKIARKTSAPMMPQNSTRCCRAGGTAK